MPGQYGSNGINSDGSLMNVGNVLGTRPSIKLFPKYNSGTTMKNLLADCGGLGEGIQENTANHPQSQTTQADGANAQQPQYNKIPLREAVDQSRTTIRLGSTPGSTPLKSTVKSPEKMTELEAQRALWDAARQGDTKLVKAALSDGADAMKPNPTDGWLALHYAASKNKRLTCQHLLSLPNAKEMVRTRSIAGETPLSLCTNKFLKNLMREAAEL